MEDGQEHRSVAERIHQYRANRAAQVPQKNHSRLVKWVLVYSIAFLVGLYLFTNGHLFSSQAKEANKVFIVSGTFANIGLLAVAFMTTSFPAGNVDTGPECPYSALGGIERLIIIPFIATVIHLVLWLSPLKEQMLIFFPALLCPLLVTLGAGFTKKYGIQYLSFLSRLISLFTGLLILAALVLFYASTSIENAFVLLGLMGLLPAGFFWFIFFRGTVLDKGVLSSSGKSTFIFFGTVKTKWPLFLIVKLVLIEWVGAILLCYYRMKISEVGLLQFGLQELMYLIATLGFIGVTIVSLYQIMIAEDSEERVPLNRAEAGVAPARSRRNTKIIERDVTALIVAHKSMKVIHNTIQALKARGIKHVSTPIDCKVIYYDYSYIITAHNADQWTPIDSTGEIIFRNHPDTRYIYLPVGNKTIAQYCALREVHTSKVLIIDDDTIVNNLDLTTALEDMIHNPNIKAFAFGIRAIPEGNECQQFQGCEYLLAGFVKLFQAKYGTTLFCHGAIALWETKVLQQILLNHDTVFDGEDLQQALLLFAHDKSAIIACNAAQPIKTISPESWFTTLPYQRGGSWDAASHNFSLRYAKELCDTNPNHLILKPFILLELYTQLMDYLRIVFLIHMILTSTYIEILAIMGLLFYVQLCLMVFNNVILQHRPDLQMPAGYIYFYPLYNVYLLILRFCGMLVNVFINSHNPERKTINTLLREGLIPPQVPIPVESESVERKLQHWENMWLNPESCRIY